MRTVRRGAAMRICFFTVLGLLSASCAVSGPPPSVPAAATSPWPAPKVAVPAGTTASSPGAPVAVPPEALPRGPELPADLLPSPPPADPAYQARRFMVETTIWQRGVRDRDVLRAMLTVPRHAFAPPEYREQAYADHPLPIGYGQTISQPYIVALMTQLAEIEPGQKVLEVGTGSGYQAAVLAEITAHVFSVEIIPQLAARAEARLRQLGYGVEVRRADGYLGWPEAAPFDAILVTAAPDHIPPPLVAQLAEGGVMVIPVGPPGGYQSLWRLHKREGEVTTEFVTGVRFVPLLRQPPGG